MIRYKLVCDKDHAFESWFRDSGAYDQQAAAGLLACPECQSVKVGKAIMAPALRVRSAPAPVDALPPTRADASQGASEASPPSVAPEAAPVALLDDKTREMRAFIRALRDKVVAEAEDVGANFAAEARRIHDGDVPARQIHGVASVAEARDLLDDGIMVLPIPSLPDEMN